MFEGKEENRKLSAMQKTLIIACIPLLSLILCYLSFGFIVNNPNPSKWEAVSRGIMIIAWLMTSVFGCMIASIKMD